MAGRPAGNDTTVRDEDFIQDMRIAAQACPRGRLSEHRYDKLGRYTSIMVRWRFGTWNAAMRLAFPELMARLHPTVDEMLADLHRVADISRQMMQAAIENNVGWHQRRGCGLSAPFYTRHGKYGPRYLMLHLGPHLHAPGNSWPALKLAAGITDV